MEKRNYAILQDFRAMQLAVKGALMSADARLLTLNGIDRISIGTDVYIEEISLDSDCVVIELYNNYAQLDIKNLSETIMLELIDTMKCKALEIANKEVMISADKLK